MALKTILLLTSEEEAPFLANWLRPYNADVAILCIPTLAMLEATDPAELRQARLIAFTTSVVVPARILDSLGHGAYNFHPGPPQFPGWAPATFAIYQEATTFGVTLHEMREKVDSGPIVGVDYFVVPPGSDVRQLEEKAYVALAKLFHTHAPALATDGEHLRRLGVDWAGRKTSRKDFARLCEIPPEVSTAELALRLRALGPGDGKSVPTIVVHGHRFKLAEPILFEALTAPEIPARERYLKAVRS